MLPQIEFTYSTVNSSSKAEIGRWSTAGGIQLSTAFVNTPIKRFFRIGSIQVGKRLFRIGSMEVGKGLFRVGRMEDGKRLLFFMIRSMKRTTDYSGY